MKISEKFFTEDNNGNVIVIGSFNIVLNDRNSDYWWFTSGRCDEIEIDDDFVAKEKESHLLTISVNNGYDIIQENNKKLKKTL